MKTTKADFAYFKKRCRYWFDLFNLNDHALYVWRGGDKKALATSIYTYSAKYVEIWLSNDWNIPITNKELDYSAYHEIMECLVKRLEICARNRDNEEEIETERHAIIHRVWNVLGRK